MFWKVSYTFEVEVFPGNSALAASSWNVELAEQLLKQNGTNIHCLM